MPSHARLLPLLLLALAARPARAQQAEGAAMRAPPATLPQFYRELRRPSARRAEVHRRLAMDLIDSTPHASGSLPPTVAESAITRLRLASAHAPDDPEILLQLGLMLASEIDLRTRRSSERRIDEAIATLQRVRALDPDYEPFLVGTELAVLATRKLDFATAASEYERAIPRALSPASLGIVLANYAEVSMHGGDLVGAVERYERSLAIEIRSGRSGRSIALTCFGLAVALDRLGEAEPAIERAWQAVSAAGGTIELLTSDGVFFEPAYELRYQQALGELALARHAPSPAERERHEEAALGFVRRFLEEGGSASPFVEAAERRREELEGAIAARARPTRGARR